MSGCFFLKHGVELSNSHLIFFSSVHIARFMLCILYFVYFVYFIDIHFVTVWIVILNKTLSLLLSVGW